MTPGKLLKLRRELARYRVAQAKAADLKALAKRLGREQVDRGKEPTWINPAFRSLRPLSIPHHGGMDLSPRVRKIVLEQLGLDVIAWEGLLQSAGRTNGDGNGNGAS